MKTVYALLILLLTFSIGNAQSTSSVETETNKTISVSVEDDNAITTVEVITVNENDSLLIDATELKKSIARSSSDIRIYLNLKRKAGNISFVFPKINKAVKA